ncbi:MAG TPA: DUF177 domain-containing protein [Candidatus Eisenbacteria bacterium]|jgi:uncharacterized protein
MTGFVLDLATLRTAVAREEAEGTASDVGLSQPEWREQVRGSFAVERSGDRVTVRGSVRSRAHLECARCLREFDLPLEAPLVVYAERTGSASREEQTELERDDHMLFHDGRRLDLRETVREILLLELPITPCCREDCPGLCPKCGADLNLGPCDCAP